MAKIDSDDDLNLRRELYEAVLGGEPSVINRVAKTNPAALKRGWTGGSGPGYLHLAAKKGHLRVCEALVKAGLDVNSGADSDGVPLDAAAMAGHLDVARWLLDHGAMVDGPPTSIATPLMGAAIEGRLDVARLLLDSGAEVNREHLRLPQTALDFAVVYEVKGTGQAAVADLLRKSGGIRPYTERHDWSGVPGQTYIEHVEGALGAFANPLMLSSFERGKRKTSIRKIRIPKKYDYQLLFTVGLAHSGVELVLCLPSAWPLNRATLEIDRFRWPVDFLAGVARGQDNDLGLDHGSVVSTADLALGKAGVPERQWLVITSETLEAERKGDGRIPKSLLLVPHSGKGALKPGKEAKAQADKKKREKWAKLAIAEP